MATRSSGRPQTQAPGIDFKELEDGKPVSITHTVEKNTHSAESSGVSAADFEDGDWLVERQDDDGWEFIDTHPGRPYEPDLRENYGRGKYKIRPVGPDGKPVDRFGDYLRVGSPRKAANSDEGGGDWQAGAAPMDDIPPSVRWQMQQAAEERAEARRQSAESRARAEEYERRQREREYEREERREREQRERAEREEAREQRRNEMMLSLAGTFGGALTTIGSSFFETKAQPDTGVNDRMLDALLAMRSGRSGNNQSLREVVEMLAVLKGIQGETPTLPPQKDDDDDIFATLSKAAPIIAMMRGGGGGAPAPLALSAPTQQQDTSQIAAMATEQILRNPNAIREVARKDPKAAARAFITAVRGDPILEAAMLEEMSAGSEDVGPEDYELDEPPEHPSLAAVENLS